MHITNYDSHRHANVALRDALTTEPVAVLLHETLDVVTDIAPNNLDSLARLADLLDWRCGVNRFALPKPDVTIGLRRIENGDVVPEMHTISLMDAETFFQSDFSDYDQMFSIQHHAIPTLASWLAHFTNHVTYAFFEPDGNDVSVMQGVDPLAIHIELEQEFENDIELIVAYPNGVRNHLMTREQIEQFASDIV